MSTTTTNIPTINELIKQIHHYNKTNNTRFVIAITGGGISALSMLFSLPGASGSILECTVPYACESTLQYTGVNKITQWAHPQTACLLASGAFSRCDKLIKLSEQKYVPIGIGATGNLVSGENLKRGNQGIYISGKSNNTFNLDFHLNLYKGEKGTDGEKDKLFRTRQEEDELCGKLIVCVCAFTLELLDVNLLFDVMKSNGLDYRDSLSYIKSFP
jgi:hypothetical protein